MIVTNRYEAAIAKAEAKDKATRIRITTRFRVAMRPYSQVDTWPLTDVVKILNETKEEFLWLRSGH
jgi:hypothetical protein